MCVHVYFLSVFIETIKLIVVTKSSSDVWLYFSFMHGYFVFDDDDFIGMAANRLD